MSEIAEVADLLLESKTTVALTGAGLSKAIGIPTYRDENGKYMDLESWKWAQWETFDTEPGWWYKRFWQFYNMRQNAVPSAGHHALRDMVEAGVIDSIVTQNIDGLDLKAGTPSSKVLEVHGNDRSLTCTRLESCDYRIETAEWVAAGNYPALWPTCPRDAQILRPDIILTNDEAVPDHVGRDYRAAPEVLEAADTLVVVGSSLPIIPWYEAAHDAGLDEDKSLVVINPNPTNVDRYAQHIIREPAEAVLPEIRDLVAAA